MQIKIPQLCYGLCFILQKRQNNLLVVLLYLFHSTTRATVSRNFIRSDNYIPNMADNNAPMEVEWDGDPKIIRLLNIMDDVG
jgi:hypothetical protein